MKKILACVLAVILLCGSALASEAPAVPQEAPSPLEAILGGLFGGDTEPETPAAAEPEAPVAAEDECPAIEVTKFNCNANGKLEITFQNNLDVTVDSFTYCFVTYNEDGTYCAESANTMFRDSYMETFNYTWMYNEKPLAPGKSVTEKWVYTFDNGSGEIEINTKRYDVIAVGVNSYTLSTGEECLLASDQMVLRTTKGDVIPATAESLEPQTFPADKNAVIAPVALGLVQYEVPVYACDFYGMPAGQHVERVLAGSPAKNAGIRVGDVIMSYDGMSALLPHADKYCRLWLAEKGAVEVTYWRKGEINTVTFRYGK